MAKENTKINYDEEEDILSLSKARKIKASIEVGEFIIDVDHKGFIAGIEILNASQNLKLSSGQLKRIEQVSTIIKYKPNYACIYLLIKLENKEKEITIPLAINLGHSFKTETMNFAVA